MSLCTAPLLSHSPHSSPPTSGTLSFFYLAQDTTPLRLPPELLETIFSYLNQATLRLNVNLVCKLWHLISNRLVRRTAVWKPVPLGCDGRGVKVFQEALLDRLCPPLEGSRKFMTRIDSLECWVLDGTRHKHKRLGVSGRPWQWHDFIAAAQSRLVGQGRKVSSLQGEKVENSHNNNDNNVGDGGRRHPFESIRHLKIYGDMIDTTKMIEDLKPCFEFLESLRIEIMSGSYQRINIFTTLNNMPRLKSVEIALDHTFEVDIFQGGGGGDGDSGGATGAIMSSGQRRYYLLEQLILDGPWIDLKTAEQIILSCPALRVLKTLKISDDGNRHYHSQWERAAVQEADEHLACLARDHCPNLQWYHADFQYYKNGLPRDAYFNLLARTMPPPHQLQAISIMSCEFPMPLPYPQRQDLPFMPVRVFSSYCTPELVRFLDRLTVLEIRHALAIYLWQDVNRLIVLCPNLQELRLAKMEISTRRISNPTVTNFDFNINTSNSLHIDWLFDTVQERKQREREERRVFREWVVYNIEPSRNEFYDGHLPIPRIWPCRHSLRALDLAIWDENFLEALTRHIRNYRLFGHLTTFRVACRDLRVGQVKEPVLSEKEERKAYELSRSLRPLGVCDPECRERYPNELLLLRGLVYLEELVMEVTRIPGTVVPGDFEFLRRMDSDFGTRSFPPPPPLASTAQRCTIRSPSMSEEDESNDDDSEDENDFGEVEAYKDVKTFWPRLTTFHVNYLRTYSLVDTEALARGIELAYIRPGVEFRFKRSLNSPRDNSRYWFL